MVLVLVPRGLPFFCRCGRERGASGLSTRPSLIVAGPQQAVGRRPVLAPAGAPRAPTARRTRRGGGGDGDRTGQRARESGSACDRGGRGGRPWPSNGRPGRGHGGIGGGFHAGPRASLRRRMAGGPVFPGRPHGGAAVARQGSRVGHWPAQGWGSRRPRLVQGRWITPMKIKFSHPSHRKLPLRVVCCSWLSRLRALFFP